MRWLALALFSACGTQSGIDAGPLDAGPLDAGPIDAGPIDAGPLSVMTFNMANGAGDRYRTAENRTRQSPIIAGAHLVALQEVDVGVERSGSLNTAAAIAGAALPGCVPEALSADGVLACSGDGGVVLFGIGFRGDDVFSAQDGGLPLGIMDTDPTLNPTGTDRRATAMYGNALIARVPVASAVVVALPTTTAPPDLGRFAALANGPLEELAAHNVQLRSSPCIEPRSVLVARVRREGVATLSVLALHLESGNEGTLRRVQLDAALAVARGERSFGRAVVILGDFNMTPSELEPALLDAGYARAAGEDIDQIWIDAALTASDAGALDTDGSSDHRWAPSVSVR